MSVKNNITIYIFYKKTLPPDLKSIKKKFAICLVDVCDQNIEKINQSMNINITKFPAIYIFTNTEKIEYKYDKFDIKDFSTYVNQYYNVMLKAKVNEVCSNLKNIFTIESDEVKTSIIEEAIELIQLLK